MLTSTGAVGHVAWLIHSQSTATLKMVVKAFGQEEAGRRQEQVVRESIDQVPGMFFKKTKTKTDIPHAM